METRALTTGKETFDRFLHEYLAKAALPSGVFEAFSYSLRAGGKKLTKARKAMASTVKFTVARLMDHP